MEKDLQHICHIRAKTYDQTSYLRDHLRAHEEKKPFACGKPLFLIFNLLLFFSKLKIGACAHGVSADWQIYEDIV
jgi:hypothetical protein